MSNPRFQKQSTNSRGADKPAAVAKGKPASQAMPMKPRKTATPKTGWRGNRFHLNSEGL